MLGVLSWIKHGTISMRTSEKRSLRHLLLLLELQTDLQEDAWRYIMGWECACRQFLSLFVSYLEAC